MVVRTVKLGGTDFADGSVLYAADMNDTFDELGVIGNSDQTGGTVSNSTTETKIGEATITADSVTNGVLIIASGKCKMSSYSPAATFTMKLRAGTSGTATSNTAIKSITRTTGDSAGGNPDYVSHDHGWTIIYYIDSLTWASLNYAQITGTMSAAESSWSISCESIQVIRF